MVRIVGFHIPSSCDKYHSFLRTKFGLKDRTSKGGYQPLTYEPRMYSRGMIEEDYVKRDMYKEKGRSDYLATILQDLAPSDVRQLIKAEEEYHQCSGFRRIFPTTASHNYFEFFGHTVPYNDKLLDAYEYQFGDPERRFKGIQMIRALTHKGHHL